MSAVPLERVPQISDIERPVRYRRQLHELLHELGKGVKYPLYINGREQPDEDEDVQRRSWQAQVRYAGVEYISPGICAEFALNDDTYPELVRDRSIVASYKSLGAGAHKLTVIETDSTRIADMFSTRRSMFRVDWSESVGIFTARARHTEIMSIANGAGEPIRTPDGRTIMPLEITDESGEPFRHISGWEPLTDELFQALEERTTEYGDDLIRFGSASVRPEQ